MSGRTSPGKAPHSGRVVLATAAVLVASVAVGVLVYRGPAAKGIDADAGLPSAARMKRDLVELLGTPAEPHTAGTAAGEAFLQRLESKLRTFGVQPERIEIPWDSGSYERHPRGRDKPIDEGTLIKSLLVKIDGADPTLLPILIATHHDSCIWGPGAGDAGSAVVALVENVRIAARSQPNRTTYFLFTDGEEHGLIGAYAIAENRALPLDEPAFVLNFDARGNSGGVPMFETHPGNAAWVGALIKHLAYPKITSSLAVTVYRSLPNATDFNIWDGVLGWHGFNYATIGDAYRYHQPHDLPENVSDRTLQHMGNHVLAMRRAVDALTDEDVRQLQQASESGSPDAVFFDLYGTVVIRYPESIQRLFALLIAGLASVSLYRQREREMGKRIGRALIDSGVALGLGIVIGLVAHFALKATPYANLVYTPIDYIAGLTVMAVAFFGVTFFLEHRRRRSTDESTHGTGDVIWAVTAALGLIASFALPGGAYLFVWPAGFYWGLRTATGQTRAAAWAGWVTLAVLIGPLLALLVQALGPWKQPLYAVLATVLAIVAMTVWGDGESVDGTHASKETESAAETPPSELPVHA